jgi:hypothetical protein
MGEIRHYNNGKWTVYTSGEDLNQYTGGTPNTIYIGADEGNLGVYTKVNSDGIKKDLEGTTGQYLPLTGGAMIGDISVTDNFGITGTQGVIHWNDTDAYIGIGDDSPPGTILKVYQTADQFQLNTQGGVKLWIEGSTGLVTLGGTTAGILVDNTNDTITLTASTTKVVGLSTYADDAAAGVGGLTTDMLYKTAGGELRIKL